MYLLLGKYESNAIALKLSCNVYQRIVEKYQSLVGLLSKGRGDMSARYVFSNAKIYELRSNVINFAFIV